MRALAVTVCSIASQAADVDTPAGSSGFGGTAGSDCACGVLEACIVVVVLLLVVSGRVDCNWSQYGYVER